MLSKVSEMRKLFVTCICHKQSALSGEFKEGLWKVPEDLKSISPQIIFWPEKEKGKTKKKEDRSG